MQDLNRSNDGIVNRRSVLTAVVGAGTTLIAGCTGGDDDDDHSHDDDDHGGDGDYFDDIGIEEFTLIDRYASGIGDQGDEGEAGDNEEPAYVDGDHWHGRLPAVPIGADLSIGARVVTDDGDELEMGEDYDLATLVADGESDEYVDLQDFGDHTHIWGDEPGETKIHFLIEDGLDVVYQTPPIEVTVVA